MSDEQTPSNRCHYCSGRMRSGSAITIHVDGPRRPIPGALMDMLSFEGETPRAFHVSCLVRYTSGLDVPEAEMLHAAIEEFEQERNERTARPDPRLVRRVLREYVDKMPEPVVEQRTTEDFLRWEDERDGA